MIGKIDVPIEMGKNKSKTRKDTLECLNTHPVQGLMKQMWRPLPYRTSKLIETFSF